MSLREGVTAAAATVSEGPSPSASKKRPASSDSLVGSLPKPDSKRARETPTSKNPKDVESEERIDMTETILGLNVVELQSRSEYVKGTRVIDIRLTATLGFIKDLALRTRIVELMHKVGEYSDGYQKHDGDAAAKKILSLLRVILDGEISKDEDNSSRIAGSSAFFGDGLESDAEADNGHLEADGALGSSDGDDDEVRQEQKSRRQVNISTSASDPTESHNNPKTMLVI